MISSIELKSAIDNYANNFEKKLRASERKSIQEFQKYYQSQYDEATDMFIRQGSLDNSDIQVLFTDDKLMALYESLYEKIGTDFAKWYAKNADKLIEKQFNISDYTSIWAQQFAFLGNKIGAMRVSLVSGTAKKTLISVTQKIMRDKDLMSENAVVKAKVLKKEFKKYSKYQSERLVRTESTNAANYATLQSAKDVFAGKDLIKQWIAGYDARTRPAHQEANKQQVKFNEKFIVGGEMLNYAGDPNGSAGNVINCRCAVAPFPIAGAQIIGPNITDIGLGLATSAIREFVSGE